MKILVVCGAGASSTSSTFSAMRPRRAAFSASARGIALRCVAGTQASPPIDLDTADIVPLGPHALDGLPPAHRHRHSPRSVTSSHPLSD